MADEQYVPKTTVRETMGLQFGILFQREGAAFHKIGEKPGYGIFQIILHKNTVAHILRDVCDMDFPGHAEQRKVVLIAQVIDFLGNLVCLNIFSGIDDQGGAGRGDEGLYQVGKVRCIIFLVHAGSNNQFIAPYERNITNVFHVVHPGNWCREALFSGQ